MKELQKVFKGVTIPVEIMDDGTMYFNISGIASKYNKRVSRWKDKKETKEYFKSVQKRTLLKETELVKQIGNEVKLHQKVFVDFARYVSTEFAVSADEIIYDILMGEKELCEKNTKKLKHVERQLKKLPAYNVDRAKKHKMLMLLVENKLLNLVHTTKLVNKYQYILTPVLEDMGFYLGKNKEILCVEDWETTLNALGIDTSKL